MFIQIMLNKSSGICITYDVFTGSQDFKITIILFDPLPRAVLPTVIQRSAAR